MALPMVLLMIPYLVFIRVQTGAFDLTKLDAGSFEYTNLPAFLVFDQQYLAGGGIAAISSSNGLSLLCSMR